MQKINKSEKIEITQEYVAMQIFYFGNMKYLITMVRIREQDWIFSITSVDLMYRKKTILVLKFKKHSYKRCNSFGISICQ